MGNRDDIHTQQRGILRLGTTDLLAPFPDALPGHPDIPDPLADVRKNIARHGFGPGGKNLLSIRLQEKDNRWTLRFRDDCSAFDPISHVKHSDGDELGIRLAMRMAYEARYTYSMNLNNLMLVLARI